MAVATKEVNKVKWVGVRGIQGEDGLPVIAPTIATASTPGSQVSVGTGGATILAANTARLWAFLFNSGTVKCFIKLGTSPATTNFSFPAGAFLRIVGYTGAVTGITSSGTATVDVIEV